MNFYWFRMLNGYFDIKSVSVEQNQIGIYLSNRF